MEKHQEKILEVQLNTLVKQILQPIDPTSILIGVKTYQAVQDLVRQLGGKVTISILHTVE